MQFCAFMYYAMKNCSLLLLWKKTLPFWVHNGAFLKCTIHLSAYSVVLLSSNFASYSEPYCNLQTHWKHYNVLLNPIWEQVKRENREIVFFLLQNWLNCDQIDHKTFWSFCILKFKPYSDGFFYHGESQCVNGIYLWKSLNFYTKVITNRKTSF